MEKVIFTFYNLNFFNLKGLLMCKGADVAILSRLNKKFYEEDQVDSLIHIKESILKKMRKYTLKGYRGLLMAMKFLSKKELRKVQKQFNRISEMNPKEKKEEYKLFLKSLENNLVLIGGSAVEDKLQERVKTTIVNLRNAQMKVWVLTGDKMETAENIALSSGLFWKV